MAINTLETATQGLIRVNNSAITLTIGVQGLLRTAVTAIRDKYIGFMVDVGRLMNP